MTRSVAPDSVRRLRTAWQAQAKGDPDCRFYTLCDKVWREEVLAAAWRAVRRNGGSSGVDGETFERIQEQGVDGWLGELAKQLRENTYRTRAMPEGSHLFRISWPRLASSFQVVAQLRFGFAQLATDPPLDQGP